MFDLPKFGRGPCLARVDALLDACGVDREALSARAIVVTGSNGKGSTSAMLAAMGAALGLRVGVFTSPHLLRWNERLRVDGRDIDDAALGAQVAAVTAAVRALEVRFGAGSFGAFEAQLAAAARWFQHEGVNLGVYEAGIGGRLDPTRLVRAPVTVLTSVDLEHTALLGATRELIALDKADACAPSGTIVAGETMTDLEDLLATAASLVGSTVCFAARELPVSAVQANADALRFALGAMTDLATPLLGRYQAGNAACAALALRTWLARSGRTVSDGSFEGAVRAGLAAVRWPGRLETVGTDPTCVVDVGHTPDAVAQAADGLFAAHGSARWLLVCGASVDKDAAAMVAQLGPRFGRVLCTQAHHKGRDARDVAGLFAPLVGAERVAVEPDVVRAVALARRIALAEGLRVYVAGGLFVAVEFAHAWRGEDPRSLVFL